MWLKALEKKLVICICSLSNKIREVKKYNLVEKHVCNFSKQGTYKCYSK